MAGYEIAYVGDLGDDLTGQMVVYLAAGSNPITAEAWETYTPPASYSLNTPRAIVFSELHVLGSPYVPTGELTYVTTSDGYTWQSVAALQRSIYPYVPITVNGQTLSPQQVAYSLTTPPAGVILVDSNDKNHENIYYGINGENASESHIQYFISDPWGNTYILKSVNAENSTPELVAQAVDDAVLPSGWTKLTPIFFQEDTTFSPSYSGLNDSIAHANEFRDSADSAWMQTTWSSSGQTLNAVAEGGLPIWAGPLGGLLLGSTGDDVIYGAQGHDIIISKEGNDLTEGGSGNDYIFGNEGNDTVSGGVGNDTIDGGLGHDFSLYGANKSTIIGASQNVSGEVIIKTEFGTDTLVNLEEVLFADGYFSVDELLENYAPPDYTTNQGNVTASIYSGASSFLHFEMFGSNSSDIVTGSSNNDFINLLGGDDAANGGGGQDVLDGGIGSNFLTGGAGPDTFFLDGRGGISTWSTITDFANEDNVNIWGWANDTSQLILSLDNQGAEGFKGATFHYDLDGNGLIDTSITFSNLALASIPGPTAEEVAGNGYLLFA